MKADYNMMCRPSKMLSASLAFLLVCLYALVCRATDPPPPPGPPPGVTYPPTNPPTPQSFYDNINQAFALLEEAAKDSPEIQALLDCIKDMKLEVSPTSSDSEEPGGGPGGGQGENHVPGFVRIPNTPNGIQKIIPPDKMQYRDELPDHCPPDSGNPNDGNAKYNKYPRDIQILTIILAHELGHVCGHPDELEDVRNVENAIRAILGFCPRDTYDGRSVYPKPK